MIPALLPHLVSGPNQSQTPFITPAARRHSSITQRTKVGDKDAQMQTQMLRCTHEYSQHTVMYNWYVLRGQHKIRHMFFLFICSYRYCGYCAGIQFDFCTPFKALVERKLWRLYGNNIQLPFNLQALFFKFKLNEQNKKKTHSDQSCTIVAILCVCALKVAVSVTLASGRIE